MKYYVYVSHTKVDMLFAQMPPKISRRIAAELDIDLKVVQVKLSPVSPEETVYSKLSLVTAYIERHEQVGTIDEPQSFFKGQGPVKWGAFGDRLVYFGAQTESTILGLAGSLRHVTGNVGSAEFPSVGPMSYAPEQIFGALEATMTGASLSERDAERQLWVVSQTTGMMEGPAQPMEFLAKRLLEEGSKDKEHVLLGSPLYVALSD